MLAKQHHNELHCQGFTVVSLHPGWAATDMRNLVVLGGMSVEVLTRALLALAKALKLEGNGKFLSYDRKILPW